MALPHCPARTCPQWPGPGHSRCRGRCRLHERQVDRLVRRFTGRRGTRSALIDVLVGGVDQKPPGGTDRKVYRRRIMGLSVRAAAASHRPGLRRAPPPMQEQPSGGRRSRLRLLQGGWRKSRQRPSQASSAACVRPQKPMRPRRAQQGPGAPLCPRWRGGTLYSMYRTTSRLMSTSMKRSRRRVRRQALFRLLPPWRMSGLASVEHSHLPQR